MSRLSQSKIEWRTDFSLPRLRAYYTDKRYTDNIYSFQSNFPNFTFSLSQLYKILYNHNRLKKKMIC